MKLIKTLPLRFNNLPYRKKLLITRVARFGSGYFSAGVLLVL